MHNLLDFERPNERECTICAVDGQLQCMKFEFANVNVYTNALKCFPAVFITADMLQPTKNHEETKDVFIHVDVPFLKQLTQVYYERGAMAVLETISNHGSALSSTAAKYLLLLIDKITKVGVILNPTLKSDKFDLLVKYSSVDFANRNLIRCIAWHPDLIKVAVATNDDSVRIFGISSDSQTVHITPLLKCKQQKNITCMAWRSMSASDIAIGCEDGIVVWNVDPQSVVTRPSTNHAIMLARKEHRPVLDLAWSPQGDVLASVAGCDGKILMWDVELDNTSCLKRPGASGHCLIKWSPKGDRVFVATTSCVFRVWDCLHWQAEKWSIISGFVQSACWSPCGSYLLFSTSDESVIYSLSFAQTAIVFQNENKHAQNIAMPLYDVTKVDIDGCVVGGVVQLMEWDPKGNYLAVMFKDSNYIAMFTVIQQPTLQLLPGFFISGAQEETPSTMAFVPNFSQGACLSIAWSSGRLQYFPMVLSNPYSPSQPKVRQPRPQSPAFCGNSSYFAPDVGY